MSKKGYYPIIAYLLGAELFDISTNFFEKNYYYSYILYIFGK